MKLVEALRAVQGAAGRAGCFAIIGAVARNAWAPPRATTDLDLAVLADAAFLARLDIALGELGYRLVREQRADPSDELPDIKVFRVERWARFWRIEERYQRLRDELDPPT